MHDVAVTIPNNVWTPFPWAGLAAPFITRGPWAVDRAGLEFVAVQTTIAAGSDGQALPQGTIHVASTEPGGVPFKPAGYLVVRIGGTDRVVQYTGKTATSFTGCTLGVGTMATGGQVRQANVEWNMPPGTVGPGVAEIAWASNGTGIRACRFRFIAAISFPAATDARPAAVMADPLLRTIACEQPAHTGADEPLLIEVFQTSGGPLDVLQVGLGAPRLVVLASNEYAHGV